MSGFTATLDEESWAAFRSEVLARAGDHVQEAARALVAFTGATIAARIEGDGAIRRVDTTRLVGSYETATAEIAGTPIAHGSAVQSGDAVATTDEVGLSTAYTFGSAVPYADYIEYGTVRMTAGMHVHLAATAARDAAPAIVEPILAQAFA